MTIFKNLKPYTVNKADDGTSAEVNLYGEIVQNIPVDWFSGQPRKGLFITLENFINELESLKDMKTVRFNINSTGGDVDAGVTIYNKIRGMKAETTTVVEGAADSAAAIIAQAGDNRQVCVGSEMMIHCASALLFDYYNSKDLDDVKSMLDAADLRIASIFADRTGRDTADVKRMMKKTTWMSADEAVDEGFADEVINRTVTVEDVKDMSNVLVFNGIPHRFSKLAMPKVNISNTITLQKSNGAESSDDKNSIRAEGGEEIMDLKELNSKYPDLVKEIQNAATETAQAENAKAVADTVEKAVKDERERIKSIDAIENMISDRDMINDAKYNNPVDAKTLAYNFMSKSQAAGQSFLNARTQDIKDSGVDKVAAAPVSGSDKESKEDDVKNGAELLKAAMR